MSAPPRSDSHAAASAQAHSPSSNTSANEYRPGPSNEKKRKLNGTSSRGVANLTPEQLAKKRANDREAQRAIRERTKTQIETLERTIKELTSQQPYQELQHVLRQKELVELENAEIKRRLAAVLDLIQPVLGNNILSDSVRSAAQIEGGQQSSHNTSGYAEAHSPAQYSTTRLTSVEPVTTRSPSGTWNTLGQTQAHIQSTSRLATQINRTSPTERIGRASTKDTFASIFRTTSAERQDLGLLPVGRPEIQSGGHVTERPGPSPVHSPAPHAESHIPLSTASTQAQYQAQTPPSPYEQLHPHPPYVTLPRNTGPSCTLDRLLLDFVSEHRARLAEGVPAENVLGPPFPNFNAILYPEQGRICHPMSSFFRDILATFPDIAAPPEKVAVAYTMFLIMRWHCHPTAENFERLPPWAKPTSWQVSISHPVWIDYLPWPEMRNEVIKNQQRYPFDSFFVPFTGTLSLNWPLGDRGVFENVTGPVTVGSPRKMSESAGNELVMSREFEAHSMRLDNWSLGPAFAHEYPMLVASVRMEDKARNEGK